MIDYNQPFGMPTETVYGLAANACSDTAVAQIYGLKTRPQFNPLIIHVASLAQAQMYGVFNAHATRLAEYFWQPSATASSLTLVAPLKEPTLLSRLALAGLSTVALRVPNHAMALDILQQSPYPLAAPSANPSHHLSPTCAQHVQAAFPDLHVIDGGPCKVGVESTIVDCTDAQSVAILRHGAVTQAMLEALVPVHTATTNVIKAPGMLAKHYSPKTPLRLNATSCAPGEALLGFGSAQGTLNLSPSGDLIEAAAHLFAYLHQLDQGHYTTIAVATIPEEGIGCAINDRLQRAAS